VVGKIIFEKYNFVRKGNNISIVHVFFGEDSVYPRVRKELFTITDLIG